MKVLFINSVCGIRSTGRIVTELAEQYMADGHQCIIAFGREEAAEKYKSISYKIGTDKSIKINALKARLFDNEGFNAKKATKKFIEFANNYNPDVLWLHNLHGYYINIELLFDWIKSRPNMQVKWTLHDCWSFTGHCAHFDFAKCDKWKTQCKECPCKKDYPASLLADKASKNFEKKKTAFQGVSDMRLITPSKWLKNLVSESFLREYKTDVVYNTINTAVFKPTESRFRAENGLEEKFVVLGVASAWGAKKGIDDFIKLSEILGDKYKVVLVGLTQKQIRSMPKSILCIERTNTQKELAEIYTAADVFVNLTYEDTYPTVNLEAKACGTPCITYRTGGSVESVDGKLIAEQGDLESIKSMIEREIAKGK